MKNMHSFGMLLVTSFAQYDLFWCVYMFHILVTDKLVKGCFTGTYASIWLPQWHWSAVMAMGTIGWLQNIKKKPQHIQAWTVFA